MEITKYKEPFEYYIIDNFIEEKLAKQLSNEFIPYESKNWFYYNNPLEIKKTLNNWNFFPPETYRFFQHLNSLEFLDEIKKITNEKILYPDIGLHGGGWHIHGNGGKLNIHLDYSKHPKLNLKRKYNLILYLSENWNLNWGGNLEFWSGNNKTPEKLISKVDCIFNRAILFDASKNSWHGFPEKIVCPKNQYRKSIAVYYMTDLDNNTEERKRALYSPTKEQKNDLEILELIKERSM